MKPYKLLVDISNIYTKELRNNIIRDVYLVYKSNHPDRINSFFEERIFSRERVNYICFDDNEYIGWSINFGGDFIPENIEQIITLFE